jgi:uncharacterized damage-inducible protein DinB
MTLSFIEQSISILERTPAVLDAYLRGLPDVWVRATEGPGTWSPYDVLGHLNHAERTDWMTRLAIMLEFGPERTFDPLDREAQFRQAENKSLAQLLDEFKTLRAENVDRLRQLDLQGAQLELQGSHPALGRVTIRQLLATWTAHDLDHIVQISRTMAKRYRQDVGPWVEYLSVMK